MTSAEMKDKAPQGDRVYSASNGGGESGFTLLEVMASLAILGIGILAVVNLFSGGLGLAGRSRDHTAMTMLAREKMYEAFLGTVLKEGITNGSANGMEWTVEVSPYDAAGLETSPGVRIFKVTANVKGVMRMNGAYALTTLKTVRE